MKEKMVLIAVFTIAIILCGCMQSDDISTLESNVNYEEISFNLQLDEGEIADVCSSTTQYMVFSIGKRNNAWSGPMIDTDRLVKYDYVTKEEILDCPVDVDTQIFNAKAYGDGIIFVTYKKSTGVITEWTVQYTDSTSNRIIDEGYCRGYSNMPCLIELNGGIAYNYEDVSGVQYECGVKYIEEGMKPSIIFSRFDCELSTGEVFPSNGDQYLLMVGKKDSKYATAIIGDKTGIIREFDLTERIVSFGINKDFAIVCTGVEKSSNSSQFNTGVFTLNAININDGICLVKDLGLDPTYRIQGGSGNTCLCVDKDFNIKTINVGKDIKIDTHGLPKGTKDADRNSKFYPVGENNYVGIFGEDKYYKTDVEYN